MKTQINVAVRMRPLLENEISQGESSQSFILDENNSIVKYFFHILKSRLINAKSKQRKEYHFDKVLGPSTTQASLFAECNIPFLLDKVVEGYHATIFAYGQTGAGKTFTMEGYTYSFSKENKNVPRIATEVFFSSK